MSESLYSIGLGLGTKNRAGEWLEVLFPKPLLNPDTAVAAVIHNTVANTGTVELDQHGMQSLSAALSDAGCAEQAAVAAQLAASDRPLVLVALSDDSAPSTVPEGYLKLHLLSHRLVKPHGTKLDGIFGVLANVAWTSEGAVAIDELAEARLAARVAGRPFSVDSIDKFPKMTDYVVPSGVRIADASRVRLGAYLGEGTTIMHEGFVNFNAGTEGPGMIEGRISAGVFVGKGSDLGGGCSTMGTLSGGNQTIISIGDECLVGAQAGVGIVLGDRCTIEAGLYITAGSLVAVLDEDKKPVKTVKARELSGQSDLLFRRNSVSGAIEALTNKSAIVLNEVLHKHN